MTLAPPPRRPPGKPVEVTIPAGTTLIRVHRGGHRADTFNPTAQPTAERGGRFDSINGAYAYSYLGDGLAVAVAETLMQDVPIGRVARRLRHRDLAGRYLARVLTTRSLTVVDLCGPALRHLGASLELTKCGSHDYVTTRLWAARLRHWCPAAAGFVYRPRHDENAMAYVLFDDGPDAPCLRAHAALTSLNDPGLHLASAQGLHVVRQVARAHNVSIDAADLPAPPRRSALP